MPTALRTSESHTSESHSSEFQTSQSQTAEFHDLLIDLSRGDGEAAAEIVDRFAPMLRAVSRRAGVPEHCVHDIVQTTWLRLLEAPHSIREPAHLGGWLKTVATREAWRTTGSERREVALSDALSGMASGAPSPEDRAIQAEEVCWLHRAIGSLPERQREVMSALMLDPAPSYEEIAERLEIPIGSIGPTRVRAMQRLRRLRQGEAGREAGLPARVSRSSGQVRALAAAS